MQGEYATATEVAELLGVSLAGLIDWQNFPGLGPKYTIIDDRMMFHIADLSKWLAAESACAGPDAVEQRQNEIQLRGIA